MHECDEHQFPEEQTVDGTRLLLPCLLCGVAAGDAIKEAGAQLAEKDLMIDELRASLDGCTKRVQALAAARLPVAEPPRPIMVDRDADLRIELRKYLDTLNITSENIGDIRRSLFLPWESGWNGWVRDETAARENRLHVAAEAPADRRRQEEGSDGH